jgi:hypothetical protein
MRMQWDESKQKLVSGGTSRTEFDQLPLPGGKKIAALSNGALVNTLTAAGVPGVSHSAPRNQNLQAYSEYVGKIMADGAQRALDAWIKSHVN